MMSQAKLNSDMSLTLILDEQTEISQEDMTRIIPLERKVAQLGSVDETFKKAISELETKLLEVPEYAKLMMLKEKQQTARRLKKEMTIMLTHEYKNVFKKSGVEDVAGVYSDLLPDKVAKSGKRGRPKRS